MSLATVLRTSLQNSLALYDDLIAELPEAALDQKLPGIRSNTVGDQFWCVVGGRESYRRAIEAGEWSGFSCSVSFDGSRQRTVVQSALSSSASALLQALDSLETFDDGRSRFVALLLEHEAAHQGQLIRYLYGLNLPIPASWKQRYALD